MKKAKKKAAKKKAKQQKDLLVLLQDQVGANPDEVTATSNRPAGPGDKVYWKNETDRGLTLTFTAWPFKEPPRAIEIDAGDTTKKFTVYKKSLAGRYGYSIDPPIVTGPPDSPAVIVED